MKSLPIMPDHEAALLLRIELFQYALQKIATDAGGISNKDTVQRMQAIATNALKGE